jgi:YHS domain-containing protein
VKQILFLLGVLAATACEPSRPPSTQQQTSGASTAQTSQAQPITLPAGWARVADPTQVCMVNNQYMGKPQIPIDVEGKTYYGCCAMCKDRLGKDPSSRVAVDPVTGQQVDKASAVIIQDATGNVMYFTSEDTLRRYRG